MHVALPAVRAPCTGMVDPSCQRCCAALPDLLAGAAAGQYGVCGLLHEQPRAATAMPPSEACDLCIRLSRM